MTDYISREALLDAILELPPKIDEQGYGWLGRRGVWQVVADFPAADVRPVVKGRWKLATYSGKFGNAKGKWYDQFLDGAFWYCDQCRERARKSNFCPNCGADMRIEAEEGE